MIRAPVCSWRCLLAVLSLAMLLATAVAAAQKGDADSGSIRSTRDGVFSSEQVERGAKTYEKTCSECHFKDFFGPAYMEGWTGATVDLLDELIRSSMPYDSPGGLERQEYVDVLAYIFSLNGMPAGETEMKAESLAEIRIEGPYEWSGEGR